MTKDISSVTEITTFLQILRKYVIETITETFHFVKYFLVCIIAFKGATELLSRVVKILT